MRLVNGYMCRNCADVELAKRGIDPAHPDRQWSGGEVFVPDPGRDSRYNLGVNQPEPGSTLGSKLKIYA
ncbi:MAG: hypothetical protein R3B13_32490 [Polyangiaceae bacterium]